MPNKFGWPLECQLLKGTFEGILNASFALFIAGVLYESNRLRSVSRSTYLIPGLMRCMSASILSTCSILQLVSPRQILRRLATTYM